MLGLVLVAGVARVAGAQSEARAWESTLDRISRAVVVLRVSTPRAFDDTTPGTSTATGFVVDAEQGLILTNRHVVTTAPVRAEAVFQDNEEVAVQAVYRDPVHDFGLFRFDPAQVRFMQVEALALAPERARVGTEVRVVGNDAGEKLSILSGTIARLDRDAPEYGPTSFNDFNTFYIQAASSTSGGSSGSPVVDIDGRVLALNAGGRRDAASSFFLPLDRVKRAVDRVRRGESVPRGTVQVVFDHKPFDEVRRLGLREATEATVRATFPEGTGLIVVREVVPGGPADGRLEVGDVIVRVAGRPVNAFLPIEAALDDAVDPAFGPVPAPVPGGDPHAGAADGSAAADAARGRSVVFEIERAGVAHSVEIHVADLHAITPDEYLEYSGGVLNPLSYHQARNASVAVGGVYVASAGYALARAGVPRRAVITELAGEKTPDLATFEAVLASKPHDARLPVRFFQLSQPSAPMVAVMRNDRRWFSMRHCRRDDETGHWPCVPSPASPPAAPVAAGETRLDAEGAFAVRRVASSLVMVRTSIPYRLDGVHGDQFHGTGLIVDTERGLVVVDRETVPIALGDITITFAGSLEVPGELIYLHPEHNLAVVRYDPRLIGDSKVRAAKLRDVALDVGDPVWMVGLTSTERVVSRRTQISRREPMQMPLTHPPRFRDTNLELATLEDAAQTVGGVLTDRCGRVIALWASFSSGSDAATEGFFGAIPSWHLERMVEPLRRGEPVGWHTVGLELEPLTLAEARDRGLTDRQARRIERSDPDSRRVLSVLRRSRGTPGDGLFREGDLILAIDGRPVTRMRHLARLDRGRRAVVEVLRDGVERTLEVEPQPMSGEGTTRAVLWAGALLQAPHPVLSSQHRIEPGGVYVSRHWFGSPATRYRLEATQRIIEVDGTPVTDLDGFLALVADKRDRDPVRLETVDLDGKPAVITLKLDLEYWPTYELRRTAAGWERIGTEPAP